ncbi:MAG: DUF885 domain-containing protein [Eubacterium sp.]
MKIKKLLSLILVIIVIFCSGCVNDSSKSQVSINDTDGYFLYYTQSDKLKDADIQSDFDTFTDSLFWEQIVDNTLNLHYSISYPENYGITDYDVSLGSFCVDDFSSYETRMRSYLKLLHSFDYSKLTTDRQLTYDILDNFLSDEISSSDLYLYYEVLSPTIGEQAQLPVLFAEYAFNNTTDIENYINLIMDVDEYFSQLIEFENYKSNNGTFMSDNSVDDIVAQCEAFINKPEENFLIKTFNERIEECSWLSADERTTYITQNEAAVISHLIPGYELLIDGLKALKGTGKNEGGLCNYDDGAEYYEYLVRQKTNSDKSIDEIKAMIKTRLTNDIFSLYDSLSNDASIAENFDTYSFTLTDPEEILTDLQTKVSDDFPEPVQKNFTVKYIDESLQDYLSPAFYLTPTIDDWSNNVIYINANDSYDESTIYTTLAHEGYPGHLYQTTYFYSTNPSLIRSIGCFNGYTEGWATYVELYSYGISGLDTNLADALVKNSSFALAIYSLCDIGINYEGWTLDDTYSFLKDYGIDDEAIAEEIFNSMVEEPANYLSYYVGYLEFINLRDEAQKELGKDFNLKEFHEFILETGPSQFDVLEKYMQKWIASYK